MSNSKYKAGDRVKFVSNGAMFGRVGTVLQVRKDGHLFIHFDGDPDGSMVFVDLTDVAPDKTTREIRREVESLLVGSKAGKVYYSVEYRGTADRPGACYGSSLIRADADAALARGESRGMTGLGVHARASRPDVAGWLPPCHEAPNAPRTGRRRSKPRP